MFLWFPFATLDPLSGSGKPAAGALTISTKPMYSFGVALSHENIHNSCDVCYIIYVSRIITTINNHPLDNLLCLVIKFFGLTPFLLKKVSRIVNKKSFFDITFFCKKKYVFFAIAFFYKKKQKN